MFLKISSYSLPISFPEKDGLTYCWKGSTKDPLVPKLKVPFSEAIVFDVYIARPITVPWKRASMNEIVMDHCPHDYYVDDMDFSMQIVYTTRCAYDAEYEGLVLFVCVESVSLQLKIKAGGALAWVAAEQHRMVATVKKDLRSDRLLLGRAQSISTPVLHNRLYIWKSVVEKKRGPIEAPLPPFGLSPRVEDDRSAEVDHDRFSNPVSAFPIIIMEDTIVIQFFNLKDRPPRFVEWSIRRSALLGFHPSPFIRKLVALKPKRKSQAAPAEATFKLYHFEEKITSHMEAKMVYRLVEKDILIEEIHLSVSNYREALESMNDAGGPKSI
jgi:hypothetical protein